MSPYNEDSRPPEGDPGAEPKDSLRHEKPGQTEDPAAVAIHTYTPGTPIESMSLPPEKLWPTDLEISWSWAHFIVFVVFGFISLAMIQGVMIAAYMPHQKMNTKQLEQYLLSKPQFAIGSMLLWYAVIFFFLYVTLSVLRGHSFWRTLGWRPLAPTNPGMPKNPVVYFLGGAGLSLFVSLATSSMKTPENAPIEELFKYRATALMFVAMAVIVAPLVEETLFRGYLYPMFARSFGILPSILLTGLLFGLMHGAQLGWTWGLVGILTAVGIIFTYVRARTGTVFASFLMHLGYNGLISAAALVTTHGFTKIPAGN